MKRLKARILAMKAKRKLSPQMKLDSIEEWAVLYLIANGDQAEKDRLLSLLSAMETNKFELTFLKLAFDELDETVLSAVENKTAFPPIPLDDEECQVRDLEFQDLAHFIQAFREELRKRNSLRCK